jgi:nucleotide-binding universal stress UspA family protein
MWQDVHENQDEVRMPGSSVSWSAFRKIVVPLDGSELAEAAMGPAMAVARHQGAEVIITRAPVVETLAVPITEPLGGVGLYWPEDSLEANKEECGSYLDEFAAKVRGQGVPLRTELGQGQPDEAILEVAEKYDADLIVMSTHGYSGVTRWVMGSITEKVLRAAQVPILVVRGETNISKMLVPLDGSLLSEKAIEPALQIARALDAKVTLLQAVPIKRVDPRQVESLESIERGLGEAMERSDQTEARLYLEGLVRRFEDLGVEMDVAVTPTPAAENILDFADRQGIQLIGMATHGRSGLRRWIYGSVTEKTLRRGCCSMLIVPPLSGST